MEGFLRKRDNRWYAVVYVEDEFGVKKNANSVVEQTTKNKLKNFLMSLFINMTMEIFALAKK